MIKTTLSFCFLLAFASFASAQTLSGQATDLSGGAIADVTVEVRSAEGVSLGNQTFANGNYSVNLPARPDDSQGVIVVFTAPGQQSVQVTVNARATHSLSVVMPFEDGNPKAKGAKQQQVCYQPVCCCKRRCRRCR